MASLCGIPPDTWHALVTISFKFSLVKSLEETVEEDKLCAWQSVNITITSLPSCFIKLFAQLAYIAVCFASSVIMVQQLTI